MDKVHTNGIYVVAGAIVAAIIGSVLNYYLKYESKVFSSDDSRSGADKVGFFNGRPEYRHGRIEQAGITYSRYMDIHFNGLLRAED